MKNKFASVLAMTCMMATALPAMAEVPKGIVKTNGAPGPVSPQSPTVLVASIPLDCIGTGASDVVSRKHVIKNTAGHPIPKGTKVSWTASNGGSGNVTLTADLPPNDTIAVTEPGQTNGYTCKASFSPGMPDFVVKSVKWTTDTTASVEIANANPWVDAAASVVRVQSLKCVTTPVSSADVNVTAIPKGGSTTVTTNLPKSAADYLQATANATNSAPESNKTNNVTRSVEFGRNKSCTPQ